MKEKKENNLREISIVIPFVRVNRNNSEEIRRILENIERFNENHINVETNYEIFMDSIGVGYKKCFGCKKDIEPFEFLSANESIIKEKGIEFLINLWNSKYVQFFCCKCYHSNYYNLKYRDIK